jgi:SRSO17 transposase
MPGRPTAAEVAGWASEVAAVGGRSGRPFARSAPRDRAVGYVRGLLGDAERKNGWHLAEYLGDPTPDGVQHLLARAGWDADAVRDDILGYVAEHLGAPGGVLIVDETGFVKKGTKSCGVARQYTGTAGRVENARVGVLLGYITPKGRALLDRALYLPKEWAGGTDRRKAAGVPKGTAFATKIVLARRMIDRAVAAGVPARWVTADAVYGSDSHFRATAEGHGLGYVVGVRSDVAVWAGGTRVRMPAMLAAVPAGGWARVSCGAGAKGPREYDGALRPVNAPAPEEYARWVLIRRGVSDPADVAYFACGGPPATTLDELVRVAGARGAIEECFGLGKGCCGLDEYEVRSWTGWHRHVTLSLFALAVVAVIRSRVAGPAREEGARSRSR